MEKFIRTIVDKMKEEKLFALQGGPIILAQVLCFTLELIILTHINLFLYLIYSNIYFSSSVMQIENEYNTVQLAYREMGHKYVQWAGNMAVSLDVGVPWVMCK